jgi:hypothetical protein
MLFSCCGECRRNAPSVNVLFSFIAYGIPIICFFAGIILGSFISETAAIGLGVVFLAVGLAAAIWLGRQRFFHYDKLPR